VLEARTNIMKDLESTPEFASSEFTNLEDRTREDNRVVTMQRIRAWFRTTLANVSAQLDKRTSVDLLYFLIEFLHRITPTRSA